MKKEIKKLLAATLMFTMLASSMAVNAETSVGNNRRVSASKLEAAAEDYYIDGNTRFVLRDNQICQENDASQNEQFVDYWNDRIENGCLSYSYYEVNTDTLNEEQLEERSNSEDKPGEDVYPVVREDITPDNIYQTQMPEEIVPPTGIPGTVTVNVSPTVMPTETAVNVSPTVMPTEAAVNVSPTVMPTEAVVNVSPTVMPTEAAVNVSPTVMPTEAVVTVSPTAIPTEAVVSVSPTVTPVVKVTTVPSVSPTPVPVVYKQYIVPEAPSNVVAVPVVSEPTVVTYDVSVEVGRRVHIAPLQQTHTKLSSSDESILSAPYRREKGDYPSFAYKPGQATLTFYSEKQQFTENWNVTVYTRALDFEQTEYVAEKTGDKDYEFVYLRLKNFEHTFEPAYYFEFSSSNKDVAEIYGGDCFSTYVRLRLKKQGATIVTVKDKWGNESSCVLIVKYSQKYMLDQTKIKLKTNVKKKTAKFTWTVTSDTELDGYEISASNNLGKSYSTIKTIKKGTTLKFSYKKLKKGKTYYFRIRGYKTVNGKKMYTPWSDIVSKVVKK